MEKMNGRKLTASELLLVRKQIIRLHLQCKTTKEIVSILGICSRMVLNSIKLYKSGGESALSPQKAGRKVGTGAFLTASQEAQVREILCTKRPEAMGLSASLWDRKTIIALIELQYAVVFKTRSIEDYLKAWGFTTQKPIKRAYQRSEPAVKKWIEETYPQIQADAKQDYAEIHWCDETALYLNDVRGREYAPIGKTPIVLASGTENRAFTMISSVANQGKIRWMIIEKSITSELFIEFLGALIRNAERKVYVIIDNLPVHHSKIVAEWVEKQQDKIALFFIPSYSPDLNPDEKFNADLKYAIGSKTPVRTVAKLKTNTQNYMDLLAKSPDRIKSYFQAPSTKYAA